MNREKAIAELKVIDDLRARNSVALAESRLVQLIESMSLDLAKSLSSDVSRIAQHFLPKRQKNIQARLSARLGKPPEASPRHHISPQARALAISTVRQELRDGFTVLSDKHIFQWSTFYHDFISKVFSEILNSEHEADVLGEICTVLRDEFSRHSVEIFTKGYEYNAKSGRDALTKSLSGLQRFLELPIDLYSSQAARARSGPKTITLRSQTSAMISGILLGYARATFGTSKEKDSGSAILPRFPRAWAHYMSFMTSVDLTQVVMSLEAGFLREGILRNVVPAVRALDKLAGAPTDESFTIPRLGQFTWEHRRLEISLAPPVLATNEDSIELQCYIDSSFADRRSLEEAANRGVSVIVASIRADLLDWATSHDLLRTAIVNTSSEIDSEPPDERILRLLEFSLASEGSSAGAAAPLTFNFAKRFPLQNPFLGKYFHIYRTSVRRLLQNFENRNGVRLWCSVRRSGKTTACSELESTTGTSIVVSQTCERTAQSSNSDLFYMRFAEALDSGRPLSPTFVERTIAECSEAKSVESQRFVFVLDEYETLFERMNLAIRRDRELRYTIVQPLLNQFVIFARENLVVFVGQRPDAHFIIMDQNQLSPYVQQDPFPLFEHEEVGGEFRELVRRVLTERSGVDNDFLRAVHQETSGHPFLTVNFLVTFVDWLISDRRSATNLQFGADDFASFAEVGLKPELLSTSSEYMFFRQIVGQALSDPRENPWLYAVYTCLRYLGNSSSSSMMIRRSEFADYVSRTVTPVTNFTPEELLSTAGQANFLSFTNDTVGPRIPLLARIAAVSRPAIKF